MASKLRARLALAWGVGAIGLLGGVAMLGAMRQPGGGPHADPVQANADAMVQEGRHTFRFDTFGDEAFWGGTLRLNEAVAMLSPVQVLGLGLKVDSQALPPHL